MNQRKKHSLDPESELSLSLTKTSESLIRENGLITEPLTTCNSPQVVTRSLKFSSGLDIPLHMGQPIPSLEVWNILTPLGDQQSQGQSLKISQASAPIYTSYFHCLKSLLCSSCSCLFKWKERPELTHYKHSLLFHWIWSHGDVLGIRLQL